MTRHKAYTSSGRTALSILGVTIILSAGIYYFSTLQPIAPDAGQDSVVKTQKNQEAAALMFSAQLR